MPNKTQKMLTAHQCRSCRWALKRIKVCWETMESYKDRKHCCLNYEPKSRRARREFNTSIKSMQDGE